MKQLSSSEIRNMFLKFFEEKNHQVERSVSLVPKDDPSLLWINSGVATLKKYFDGSVVPDNPRIVNVQKSIRTNDIENVGFTARHHTFFEMLGNFSIGDYFKREAIHYAWEFLTSEEWIGFDPNKLSITVHPEDDEAYDIWVHEIQIPEERVIRLEENFWDIGEGPSGPNTEIFYDRGPSYGNDPKDPELYPGGENERYLEVWNLVFSQFNHNPDDTYTLLPQQNIDTGMGLERLVSILQDAETNFDTDLFLPIIKKTEEMAEARYGESKDKDTAFKIIADHIRTVTFAIGDHALPSNEGRGYILRRLIRRAVRYAKNIGIEEPFMYKLVPTVGGIMESYYPEVKEQEEHIMNIIKVEEERFHETLNDGLVRLHEIIEKEKAQNLSVIPGEEVFKLYDTYGFPKELTEEYVEEYGFTIDEAGFEKEMEKQRTRAREAREQTDSMQVQNELLTSLTEESTFVGYDRYSLETEITQLFDDESIRDFASEGETLYVILTETPFYAESGGQVADQGIIESTSGKAKVVDVQKAPNGQHMHRIEIESGKLKKGDRVLAKINDRTRDDIVKNHTATHLLHRALRDVLGDHIHQAGSLVTANRLRFDFSHFEALTEEELEKIERQVNEKIWSNLQVEIETMELEEAKARGAMALFDEKYDNHVRVVNIGDYSIELCGGCHVQNTAEIGLFKIIQETGIGAGVRRIEAVTSRQAYEYLAKELSILHDLASQLKTDRHKVSERLTSLLNQLKELERENESLHARLANEAMANMTDEVEVIAGVNVLAKEIKAGSMDQLRKMVDELKQKLRSGVILLAMENKGKVQFISGVTDDLVKRNLHAGHLIKQAAQICGGGGGGRPDMAQAGGRDLSKINEALESVKTYVEENIK